MYGKFNRHIYIIAGVFSLVSCNSPKPEIETVCHKDSVGNYVIKWETSPKIKGTVQIFESDAPSAEKSSPFTNIRIEDGVATYVASDNFARKYFRLVFNRTYQKIVSSRWIEMDSVSNIRDLGGYSTKEGRTTSWGKVFRTGDLSRMGDWDYMRLDRLKIKTIIDMRMDSDVAASPVFYPKAQVISIPVVTPVDYVVRQVVNGKFRRGDVSLYMQDMFLQFTDDKHPFAQAMTLFLDEANYPILIADSQGKDCAGFLSALLLSALNIPESTVLADYVGANEAYNLRQYRSLTDRIDDDRQEALTAVLSPNAACLNLAFNKIKNENGSVVNYLAEELHFTDKQMEKLRRILLY